MRGSDEAVAIFLIAMLGVALAGCQTSHGATWPAFGTYRLPYSTGTTVKVWQDFETHDPIGRYDLHAESGPSGAGAPFTVVAAADGWIRIIRDFNVGGDEADNNYVWIEHPYPFCQGAGVTWPNKPADYAQTCIPCLGNFCNEWTKYTHVATNSVTAAGRYEGDLVLAGTPLGQEGSVGSEQQHLHWEVARLDPDHPVSDDAGGWPEDWSNNSWIGSPDLLPSICGIGLLEKNDLHVATSCPASSRLGTKEGANDVAASVRWTWQGRTVTASARVRFTGPDSRKRMTLAAFALDQPISVDGAVVIDRARLIRPVTFTLRQDGTGEFPADLVLVSANLTRLSGTSSAGSRSVGPLRGSVVATYASGRLRLSLNSMPLGTLVVDVPAR
jgi:murein DD-endopeptidase MepM/ murein hydrolase activator NlpD